MSYPAVILAGGLARRMGGGDKGLLQLGQSTILAQVIARLSSQANPIAINANGAAERFAQFDLPVIADSVPDFPGPLAGVLAGLDWAADLGAEAIVTAAADTPFLPPDLVQKLDAARRLEDKPIALASTTESDGHTVRHPTFGLWPVALRDDLRTALRDGVRKVVLWTDRHGTALARFGDETRDPFFNVNTPEDLQRAQEMMQEASRA